MNNEEINKLKLELIEKILFGDYLGISSKEINVEGKEYIEVKALIKPKK